MSDFLVKLVMMMILLLLLLRVKNQGGKKTHETVSPEWGQRPNGRGQCTNRTPELGKNKPKNANNRGIFEEPARSGTPELKIHQKTFKNPSKIHQKSIKNQYKNLYISIYSYYYYYYYYFYYN